MIFGVCCGEDFIPVASAAGYDYIEPGVWTTLLPESDGNEHIEAIQAKLALGKIGCEAFNLMLPPVLKCVDFAVDTERLDRYFASAAKRASALGARILVFGSGGQRSIPEGLPFEEGRRQFKEAVALVGKHAAEYGIVIAIEPLNRTESNLVNSVAEGLELVNEIDLPSVRVLSDLYHIEMESEPYSETTAAGALLAHVHVAGNGRRAPVEDDFDLLTRYFSAVKAAGYDQRVSIEANWTNLPAQAAEALGVVKRAWDAAQ